MKTVNVAFCTLNFEHVQYSSNCSWKRVTKTMLAGHMTKSEKVIG